MNLEEHIISKGGWWKKVDGHLMTWAPNAISKRTQNELHGSCKKPINRI